MQALRQQCKCGCSAGAGSRPQATSGTLLTSASDSACSALGMTQCMFPGPVAIPQQILRNPTPCYVDVNACAICKVVQSLHSNGWRCCAGVLSWHPDVHQRLFPSRMSHADSIGTAGSRDITPCPGGTGPGAKGCLSPMTSPLGLGSTLQASSTAQSHMSQLTNSAVPTAPSSPDDNLSPALTELPPSPAVRAASDRLYLYPVRRGQYAGNPLG